MFELLQSTTFQQWLVGMKDRKASAIINMRLRRVSAGNLGDCKALRDGISELRIDYGPGYRVYFKRVGPIVLLLLAGGDKRTQSTDIKTAIQLAKDWEASS